MSTEQHHESEIRTSSASPTRTKATWKPRVASEPLPFFSHGLGNHAAVRPQFLLGIDDGSDIALEGDNRTPEMKLPYVFSSKPHTDSLSATRVMPDIASGLIDRFNFQIKIVGGFNVNALEVRWGKLSEDCQIRWFALKTFTGVQLKYMLPTTRQPLVFGLAGDDAYAYCDKTPCEDCMFHCKRGFELSVCIDGVGICTIPIHEPS